MMLLRENLKESGDLSQGVVFFHLAFLQGFLFLKSLNTAMESKNLGGIYPAIIKSYNQATRTCKIAIQGFTDGSEEELEAELEYPLGDKSKQGNYATEIEVLPNDLVWVMFIGGDARYPLITGYRNPQTGNSADRRRWHHKNFELTADNEFIINAGVVKINARVEITGKTDIKGNVTTTGTLKNNDVNVGSTHTHNGVQTGSGNTGVPN